MNGETFERALEIVMHRRLTEHEAAHCTAALLQNLPVAEACAPFHRLADLEAGDPDSRAGQVLIETRDGDDEHARKLAIALIAGPLEDSRVGWPPAWPLTLAPEDGDPADLVAIVKQLDLDRAGYAALVQDALELTASREFDRLHVAISHALERHGRLDADALRRIKALSEGAEVRHATKAATVTATEQGEFTAIAAAYTVDRVNDQIVPGAFAATIERWRASGKRMPLHWNHQGEAANVIGYIDPASMRETGDGLRVSGKLDIDTSDTAREAWRSMKNNAMSLSFGYVTVKQQKRSDGINELHELDLFEISIVPAPANSDTRVLEMKSIGDDLDMERFKRKTHDEMFALLSHGGGDTLRAKSNRLAREHGPIEIASFDA
jgi:HK97 family phage prohead protease